MSTFLFDKVIFGPIHSRRLGSSLGINLLPTNHKICSFDCVYCECGFNTSATESSKMPSRKDVSTHLEIKLKELAAAHQEPDVITFAGNGEPTLHKEFPQIIDDTIALRNSLCPNADIAVLTNSTMIHDDAIVDALLKVDQHALKLDSAIQETVILMNQPAKSFKFEDLIPNLQKFKGNLTIQTMFLRGTHNGKNFDNTTELEVNALIDAYKQIKPAEIMIYSIARDTPIQTLQVVDKEELTRIAKKIESEGFNVKVS